VGIGSTELSGKVREEVILLLSPNPVGVRITVSSERGKKISISQ